MITYFSTINSPIGELLITSDGHSITGLYLDNRKHHSRDTWQQKNELFKAAQEQLSAYFAREIQTFDLPIATQGTEFQQQVWNALMDIPYGKTVSYGSLAKQIGKPKSSRAIGMANGANPISIIIPCHRVIGTNGSLTGYSGGIERKRWLLKHESAIN